ncbi:hypothetical protein HNR70_000009 [Brachybacterium aquaticum]|uniref:Uncharacterized protein n=1 Tax=Brachybacterium aquaticum TaxID=1432564 RepID=A0A841A5S8_9MICO|nr:hypothetical protein [Brachybacterium aquaticum]
MPSHRLPSAPHDSSTWTNTSTRKTSCITTRPREAERTLRALGVRYAPSSTKR